VLFVLGPFSQGFFHSLGTNLGQSASHLLATVSIPTQYIPIMISAAGVGIILYKVFEEKFQRKITQVDVKTLMDKEELDQIDKQDSERNERDDRYTPANMK
jgi:hypothetical protein